MSHIMLSSRRFKDQIPLGVDRGRPLKKGALQESHHRFRRRYMVFLSMTMSMTMFIFLGLSAYYLTQNYSIFKKLAFQTNPQLIAYLDREITWFLILLSVCTVAVLGLSLYIGHRITMEIIRPLIHMERHMKKVIKGDLKSDDFRFSKAEELFDFFSTYSYLYRSMRAQTQTELKLLEKLVIDPHNRESMNNWKQLIETKRRQLAIPEEIDSLTENAPKISESADFRRVS